MLFVLACLIVGLGVFALVALADKRRPDHLSRRGRHLAGLPEDAPTAKRRSASPPSPSPSKYQQQRLDRLHFGTR
jgi:hypothetical protein